MSDIPIFCIEADNERPCVVCGKMTNYVEIGVEHSLCRVVCIDKFYEMIYGREVL